MKNLFVLVAVGMMSTFFSMSAMAGGCSNQSSGVVVGQAPVYGGGSGIVYHNGGGVTANQVITNNDGLSGPYSGSTYYSSRGVNVGAGYGGVGSFGSPTVYQPRGGSFYRGSVGFGNGVPGRGFGNTFGAARTLGGFGRSIGGFRGLGSGIGLGF